MTSYNPELMIVGAALLSQQSIDIVRRWVRQDDISDPLLQRAWYAITQLRDEGESIDHQSVWARMGQPSEAVDVLAHATDSVPTVEGIETHAKAVLEAANRRRLLWVSGMIEENAKSKDISWVIQTTVEAMDRIQRRRQMAASGASTGLSELMASIERGETPTGVATGIGGASSDCADFLYPELTILGASPGEGKSTLALNVLEHVAKTSVCTYVTLEDSREAVQTRLLSMQSRVPGIAIRKRVLTQSQMRDVCGAAPHVAQLGERLRIADIAGATWSDIAGVCTAEVRQQDSRLIVVDHLSAIQTQLDECSHVRSTVSQAAALAQRLQVPIVMLHHLRKNKVGDEPTKADLLYGGDKMARCVWLLHRKPRDDGTRPESGNDMVLIVAKRNQGPEGRVRMEYHFPTYRIGNVGEVLGVNPFARDDCQDWRE